MDNRLGRIGGVAAFVLMLLRLRRLVDTGVEAPAWEVIMIASVFLGGVVWWLLRETMSNRRLGLGLFAFAGLVLFLRVSVPQTLLLGFLPGPETPGGVVGEMAQALDLIRFGVAPVFPTPGIVALLSVLMWVTGALFLWGASGGPSLAMTLPSLGLYLEFAVMDRVPSGRGWMGAAALVIALALAAVAVERRREAGRLRDKEGRPLPRRAGSLSLLVAVTIALASVFVASAAATLVPESGTVRWRTGGGYGAGLGGVAFDRLADLRQSIIRRTNAVLFRATLDPNAPPGDQIYWWMESLDVFDGTAWRPSPEAPVFYEPGLGGGDPDYAYRGTSQKVTARIQVDRLRSQVVPTPGIGQLFRSDSVNVSAFQVLPTGAVIYQAELDAEDEYEVLATLALSREDLGALATLPDGSLSPLFANAAQAGATSLRPGPAPGEKTRPSDIDRYLQLPDDLPEELAQVARERTAGASTDFERAWLLQYWFRDSGDFTYSTDVSTGNSSLYLSAWLTDPESQNYRIGYCEQFAAAMGVLGRVLGIPTRVVWGFTPGAVETQSDGTEVVVVRDRNAHAWVEMWMDGFGWVSFDPTPRRDGVQPPSITAEFDPEPFLPSADLDADFVGAPGDFGELGLPRLGLDDTDLGLPATGSQGGLWLAAGVVALVVLALGALPLAKAFRRRRRLRRIREGDVTAAWDEIVDRLTDLGAPVPAHQTPLEFAQGTDRSLVPLARTYSAAVYGGREGNGSEGELAAAERWIRLRYDDADRARAAFSPRSLLRRE